MKNNRNDKNGVGLSTFYDVFKTLESNRESAIHFFSRDNSSNSGLALKERRKLFTDIHEDIQICYNNLAKIGINNNSVVGLNIENSYYFFVCDFALILMGATTVLHSKNDPVEQLKNRIDLFHIDYLISRENVPAVPEDICPVIELNQLFDTGAARVEIKKRLLENRDFSIVFSSGTSGIPKGLSVSEHGSIESGKLFFNWMNFSNTDKFLIYLPLASYQQRFLMWSCLIKNVDIVLVDDKTLFKGLETFKPTILIAPPNFYFNLYRINTGSAIKQFIRELLPYNKKSKLLKFIARSYTYRPLYKALGGKTRYLITGMAPVDIKILEHFEKGYLDIYQIYGQTEIGMIACNKLGANKLGTVGRPIIKIHLADDDEIITNSNFPTIKAYYLENVKRVELGKQIPTGDVGNIDQDGYLSIKGRKNETIILKSGVKINPALIENRIKSKVNIDEVIIFKSDGSHMKTDLNVTILAKSPGVDNIEMNKIKGVILNEPEIKQNSEKVSILTYSIKKEDRKIMYTENNKFSRARTLELLKRNYRELKLIG
ncbi:MAG: AMP-binding protein [Candidatus Aminicenantes bacterium]|nr:MAG: AMP-binding protein [Candidatus Aminicenantes bacterium]